jgi:uncharacterized protein
MEQQTKPIIDIHSHLVIHSCDFPNKFISTIAKTKVGLWLIENGLDAINPFSDTDNFSRMSKFIRSSKETNWEKKFLAWRTEGQWSNRTKIVVLTVNMSEMGCGKPKVSFTQACADLEELRKKYPDIIIPFFHYDCRAKESYELFQKYVVNGEWGGVKMYNSMGTFPQDIRYHRMYLDLIKCNKPIIAHCTYSNPIHFVGKEKNLKILLGDKYDKNATRKQNCDKFTDPRNWFKVAEWHPELRIDLAHGGGSDQWRKWWVNPYDKDNLVNVIINGMAVHKNVYFDTAFTLNDEYLFPMFKRLYYNEDYPFLKDRILFGTDWDMTVSAVSLKQYSDNFRYYIGEEAFNQIARENNHKFLNI